MKTARDKDEVANNAPASLWEDEFGQLLEVGVLAGSEGRPSDLEQ